jgi:hypothetical protein
MVASVPVFVKRILSGHPRAAITFSAASTSRRWVMAKLVACVAASATALETASSPWPRMMGPKPHCRSR